MLTQGFQNLNFFAAPKGPAKFAGQGGKESAASGAGGQFKSVLDSLMGRVKSGEGMDVDALMNMINTGETTEKKSMDLLSLLAGNISQDKSQASLLTVDDTGLASLKKLLTGLGFDENQVGKFIQSLSSKDSGKQVSLTHMFSKLGEFLKENESGDELEISDLPFMQSLLNGFGIQPDQVEALLNKAAKSGQGLDLDTLVADLKQLADNSPATFQGAVKSQNTLLAGLGMKKESGMLTLSEFADKLETMIREKNPAKASPEALSMAAKSFGDAIKQGKASSQGGVDVSMMTPVSESDDALDIGLEKSSLKKVQAMTRDKNDEAFFSGSKNDSNKARLGDTFKDTFAAVTKEVKPSLSSAKEGPETLVFNAKTMSGTEVYEKIADSKSALPSEKTLPSYVTEQVTRQIGRAVKMGESEITFHIKPPDLGRVQLSIEHSHEGMKIRIVTEQHATRDMIMSHANDMRTMLADQGIRLDKIDVDVSGNFGQSMAQARQEAGQSGKERKNRDGESFSLDKTAKEETEEPEVRRVKYARGNLDLVA